MMINELVKKIIVAASKLIDPDNCMEFAPTNDIMASNYAVVRKKLLVALRKSLEDLKDYKEPVVEKSKEVSTIELPENVAICLAQVHGYGIDLYNYKETEKELKALGDLDVVTWLRDNRSHYKDILALIFKR